MVYLTSMQMCFSDFEQRSSLQGERIACLMCIRTCFQSLTQFSLVNTDLSCHEEIPLTGVLFGLKQTVLCKLKKPPVCSYSVGGWSGGVLWGSSCSHHRLITVCCPSTVSVACITLERHNGVAVLWLQVGQLLLRPGGCF